MKSKIRSSALVGLLCAGVQQASAANVYGPQLEGFAYPYPLKQLAFRSQGKDLQMGYLDVPPKDRKSTLGTAVLLHGKNFCAATWEGTIKQLSEAGYRVIAPDQVGFCSSSKPEHYQYTFQQLAHNTHALLQHLGVDKASVVGHSTGGMLAVRYALMYPTDTSKLVLVNPIGLEDWKAMGVPYRTVDQWFERELKVTAQSIKAYEQKTYYDGRWKPEYDTWVDMLAGLNAGPGKKAVAWNSALVYDMIFTQPVVYEFPKIQVPTLLMIGQTDTTAIGSDIASAEVKAKLGDYPALGKAAQKAIPGAELIEFAKLGHAPQMEEPRAFNETLVGWLEK